MYIAKITQVTETRYGIKQKLFYDPRIKEYALVSPKLAMEANKLASFSFTIYKDHPCYDELTLKKTWIWIYQNDDVCCIVRPVRRTRNFNGGMEYECEEVFGVMNDYILRPDGYGKITTLEELIYAVHNMFNQASGSPVGVLFDVSIDYYYPGHCTHAFDSEVNEKAFAISDYRGGFDGLYDYVISKYTGYFQPNYKNANTEWTHYIGTQRIVHSGRVRYEYHTESELPEGEQVIQFGKNLVDLFIDTDSDDLFTVLIPLGKDKSTTKAQRNLGLPNKLPITIEAATNRDSRDSGGEGFDVIRFNSITTQYGNIEKTVRFETAATANALYTKGLQYYVDHAGHFAESVSLTAVDLADAGVDIENIKFLTRVLCISTIHGIGQRYLVRKMSIHLDNPSKCSIELGRATQSLTDITTTNRILADSVIEDIDNRVYYLENG